MAVLFVGQTKNKRNDGHKGKRMSLQIPDIRLKKIRSSRRFKNLGCSTYKAAQGLDASFSWVSRPTFRILNDDLKQRQSIMEYFHRADHHIRELYAI